MIQDDNESSINVDIDSGAIRVNDTVAGTIPSIVLYKSGIGYLYTKNADKLTIPNEIDIEQLYLIKDLIIKAIEAFEKQPFEKLPFLQT
jgi:hypothetical protein